MGLSDFRVPNQMLVRNSLSSLQTSFARLADLQDQAASGKKLRKPSDAPADIVPAMRLHSGLNRNDQYQRNIEDANGWLGAADNALSNTVDQLHRVRDLVVAARNASSDTAARQAFASEIDSLRDSIIGIANSQYAGRPIFGGTSSGAVAYDSTGNYVGFSAPIERTIAPGQRVQVNVNGEEVFGTTGADIFTTLAQVSAAIQSNPSGLDALAATLETQINTVEVSQGTVGSRFKRVDDMKSQNTADSLTMRTSLTGIEDIDLAEIMVSLNAQQVAYEAALTATAKAITPSLVDFLR
jgi:flagellar hook-associated protein 3 FlgL